MQDYITIKPVSSKSYDPQAPARPRLSRPSAGSSTWLSSQPQLAGRTFPAEFGPSDIAAHGGQAAMSRVTHNFLVRHAIAVGRSHEPSAQAVWADRFRQCAPQSGPGCTLEKDLAHRISAQPVPLDGAATLTLRNSGPIEILDNSSRVLRDCVRSSYWSDTIQHPANGSDVQQCL
jgi:hypothetical protein